MAKERKMTSIGGQALIEGILMRGPRKTAIVVRKTNGEMVTKVENIGTATHGKLWKLPLFRGVIAFWDSMRYGVGALNYSASFFEDEEDYQPGRFEQWLTKRFGQKKIENAILSLAVVLGIAMPVVLFFLLPTFITGLFGDSLPNLVRNIIEGCVRITIFILFVFLTSKQRDVHRTYMYHGAEHKTIACYEAGLPLTVENARVQSRRHPRCGTSFMFVVMIVGILFTAVFGWGDSALARMALRLALLPAIVAVSYEVNRYAGRNDNALTRFLRAPGLFMQRLTTFEPDDSMLEVAIEAMNHVIPENDGEDRW